MSKTLFSTITIKVPEEMVEITKTGKVSVKKTLTKMMNLSNSQKQASIKLIPADIDKPVIVNTGKQYDVEDLKERVAKSTALAKKNKKKVFEIEIAKNKLKKYVANNKEVVKKKKKAIDDDNKRYERKSKKKISDSLDVWDNINASQRKTNYSNRLKDEKAIKDAQEKVEKAATKAKKTVTKSTIEAFLNKDIDERKNEKRFNEDFDKRTARHNKKMLSLKEDEDELEERNINKKINDERENDRVAIRKRGEQKEIRRLSSIEEKKNRKGNLQKSIMNYIDDPSEDNYDEIPSGVMSGINSEIKENVFISNLSFITYIDPHCIISHDYITNKIKKSSSFQLYGDDFGFLNIAIKKILKVNHTPMSIIENKDIEIITAKILHEQMSTSKGSFLGAKLYMENKDKDEDDEDLSDYYHSKTYNNEYIFINPQSTSKEENDNFYVKYLIKLIIFMDSKGLSNAANFSQILIPIKYLGLPKKIKIGDEIDFSHLFAKMPRKELMKYLNSYKISKDDLYDMIPHDIKYWGICENASPGHRDKVANITMEIAN
jgi:hypothetical protein